MENTRTKVKNVGSWMKTHPVLLLALTGALAVVCLGIAFLNRDLLSEAETYPIEATSEVAYGKNGQTLVIDNGKKTLLVLDADGRIVSRYDGGDDSSPFYYACYAAQAEDGSIYVADIKYGDRGNLIDRERITRLSGNKWETVYEIDYMDTPMEDTPLQYGTILELQEYNGRVYFVIGDEEHVEVHTIDDAGQVVSVGSIPLAGIKTDATYDAATNSLVVITRRGDMYCYGLSEGLNQRLTTQFDQIPYDIAARNGEVYYTEVDGKTIRHFPVTELAPVIFYELDEIPYKLDVSEDGKNVLVTNQAGFYRLTGDEAFGCSEAEYIDSAPVSYFASVVLTWIALVLGAAATLILLLVLGRKIVAVVSYNESALRVMLIVIASLAVAFILSYSMLKQILTNHTAASKTEVKLFSELLLSRLDADALAELDAPNDYGTKTHNEIKAPLDDYTLTSYENGDYYYYIIYRIVNGNVVMVMDFEDTMPCTMPMYIDDPEDNDYSAVMHTGEEVLISEISAYGAWTFLLSPVYDSDGNIVGELEVGQSLDAVQSRQNELRNETIINVAISTIVVAMLLLELTFLLGFVQKKRETKALDSTETVPLRTMMFLIYLADSMQDAFIAILCSQLYSGGLPISDGVAIALPMSAQLLMMALFSFFAGRLAERMGSKKVMTGGMLVYSTGFLLCMLLGNYVGLLIGKVFIGAGMGTVYVACNTVAATGSTSDKIAAANASVSAGTLAGLTIGAGLASVLLSMGGWRLIYLIGALIGGFGLLLAMFSGDVKPGSEESDLSAEQMIGPREFFTSRRVIGFFLLILVPFMMALAYREYFFPLYAQEHGVSEVRIGQIYLVCGMLVLYIGPYLSSWMIRTLGAYWSIIAASAAMGFNMLMFVLFPSLATVIMGVVVLSLIISFAYTCQYTYYELTPEMLDYGEGRAMGVYSVFESIGQTIGPMAYGALLALGYVKGIGVFCAVMLLLIAIFIVLMRKLGKFYR